MSKEELVEKLAKVGINGEWIDADALHYVYRTNYSTVYTMVQNGNFLCYYHQVIEFIKTLNLNNSETEYDAEKTWRLYCHLIAREGAKILEKGSY